MTIKELRVLLKNVPDDYVFIDECCLREIGKDAIYIDKGTKTVRYSN